MNPIKLYVCVCLRLCGRVCVCVRWGGGGGGGGGVHCFHLACPSLHHCTCRRNCIHPSASFARKGSTSNWYLVDTLLFWWKFKISVIDNSQHIDVTPMFFKKKKKFHAFFFQIVDLGVAPRQQFPIEGILRLHFIHKYIAHSKKIIDQSSALSALCVENTPVSGRIPVQMASNAESVPMS